jgi:hypothetical protein
MVFSDRVIPCPYSIFFKGGLFREPTHREAGQEKGKGKYGLVV